MDKLVIEIEQEMVNLLNNMQMEELHKVLLNKFQGLNITENDDSEVMKIYEVDYCNVFICAKRVEGCSEKSIKYYSSTIENMLKNIDKPIKHITTEDLRDYLSGYYKKGNCSKVTLDNIRRILSTFFLGLKMKIIL